MKIPSQAYLDNANHGFATGVRTAVMVLLDAMGERDLLEAVSRATDQDLLSPEDERLELDARKPVEC